MLPFAQNPKTASMPKTATPMYQFSDLPPVTFGYRKSPTPMHTRGINQLEISENTGRKVTPHRKLATNATISRAGKLHINSEAIMYT